MITDVAMVIITILIAKLYFPECLESRDPEPPSPRSYAYRIVQTTNPTDENHPIDECVEEGDETECLTQPMETLLSDPNESDTTTSRDFHFHRAPSFSTRPSLLEFDQERLSKGQVFKRLLLCVVMLNLTFVSWGVLQERMLTRRYPRETGEYFTYSHTLVFTNRFWTLIMSALLWMYFKPKRCYSTVLFEYAFPSISNLLSSWCQYEALRYVSFPAAILIKSFKLAPVMAMGMVLGNKSCE
jgi:UAA transporter family